MEGLIGDIPWGTGYRSEKLGLVSLDDSYVGLRSTSPKFYSIQCLVPLDLEYLNHPINKLKHATEDQITGRILPSALCEFWISCLNKRIMQTGATYEDIWTGRH